MILTIWTVVACMLDLVKSPNIDVKKYIEMMREKGKEIPELEALVMSVESGDTIEVAGNNVEIKVRGEMAKELLKMIAETEFGIRQNKLVEDIINSPGTLRVDLVSMKLKFPQLCTE